MTYTALLILERMNEDATTRMTELASSVGVTCVTITRQIQDLERKGVVLRVQDNQDGRVSIVRLTEEGSRAAEVATVARRDRLGQAVGDWSDDDLEQMIGFFQRLPDQILQSGTAPTSVFMPGEECSVTMINSTDRKGS
jgi:DNA-binding MarR family transcriptional regulator